MLERIHRFFLKRKLIKQYYNEQAENTMQEFIHENKGYIGVYGKDGKIKSIHKLEVV